MQNTAESYTKANEKPTTSSSFTSNIYLVYIPCVVTLCPLPSRLGDLSEPRPQTPFHHFLSVTERFR